MKQTIESKTGELNKSALLDNNTYPESFDGY